MRVYVLLYNSGTANEGIHTLQTHDANIVLMFESEDDATRYALLLEAQDFLSPTVENIDSEEIEEFCRDAGYESKFIEAGMLAIPPETNIENTQWNLEGDYANQTPLPSEDDSSEMSQSEMSQKELDYIRRKLESLL